MPLGPVGRPGARGRPAHGPPGLEVLELPLVHEAPLAPEGMQCITTKTWRRLKMKKHKASKRHKLLRHKAKNTK
ncbi:hypothetical protein TSOC_006793 [Tetrabaena socialis]|uniref:Uncharacterized protein n=1 Tax=Tetrabaena socialis TaxID=47790 RepID=A0A2J8A2U0_9CHLO|nr:hypothetical protein TSOC_006793 [Tetrabaena socialis]|eukprot:PNH06808.1 hypothetical protein TSOC_006793 [Tetrabaena socialis]